jgi:hypothetical protein
MRLLGAPQQGYLDADAAVYPDDIGDNMWLGSGGEYYYPLTMSGALIAEPLTWGRERGERGAAGALEQGWGGCPALCRQRPGRQPYRRQRCKSSTHSPFSARAAA